MIELAPIEFSEARYAKGKWVAKTPSDGSGWKTRSMFLIEDHGGKWIHRDEGYQITAKQMERIKGAVALNAVAIKYAPLGCQ